MKFWEKVKAFFKKLWQGLKSIGKVLLNLLLTLLEKLWGFIKLFLQDAYIKNSRLWMYAIGGSAFGLLSQKLGFLHSTLSNTSYGFVLAGLGMLFAILSGIKIYAVSEMTKNGHTIKELFGSYIKYIADLFGDVTMALVSALFVLLV